MKWRSLIIGVIILGAIIGAIWWAFQPHPIGVDVANIKRGTLILTVDDEGIANIKDTYQISTPIGGDIERIPFTIGDFVEQGRIVATITPQKSPFLDERSLMEAQAGVKTAQAALKTAQTSIEGAKSEVLYWQNEEARTKKLLERGLVTKQTAEQIRLNLDRATTNLESAESNLELRQRQLEQAQAHLLEPNGAGTRTMKYYVKAPISGKILQIANDSARSLPAGTHLLTIGNPRNLEIVVDILSTDAVKIKTGAPATIEKWGKEDVLEARVILIEPIGFTKISALGIEEQRVKVHLEILSDWMVWQSLGHLYRVFVRIEEKKVEKAILVPSAALFRNDDKWAVFIMEGETAKLRQIDLGTKTASFAQAINNINEGEKVILHPSDNITDGALVVERTAEQ